MPAMVFSVLSWRKMAWKIHVPAFAMFIIPWNRPTGKVMQNLAIKQTYPGVNSLLCFSQMHLFSWWKLVWVHYLNSKMYTGEFKAKATSTCFCCRWGDQILHFFKTGKLFSWANSRFGARGKEISMQYESISFLSRQACKMLTITCRMLLCSSTGLGIYVY